MTVTARDRAQYALLIAQIFLLAFQIGCGQKVSGQPALRPSSNSTSVWDGAWQDYIGTITESVADGPGRVEQSKALKRPYPSAREMEATLGDADAHDYLQQRIAANFAA